MMAQVSKQLMIMSLAIGQTFFFVMAVSEKRFLAFCAHKMLKKNNSVIIRLKNNDQKTGWVNFDLSIRDLENNNANITLTLLRHFS